MKIVDREVAEMSAVMYIGIEEGRGRGSAGLEYEVMQFLREVSIASRGMTRVRGLRVRGEIEVC